MDCDKSTVTKNERLELRPNARDAQLTVITRKKPTITKIERSGVLNKVKAFLPTINKAQSDLWRDMKVNVSSNRKYIYIFLILNFFFKFFENFVI